MSHVNVMNDVVADVTFPLPSTLPAHFLVFNSMFVGSYRILSEHKANYQSCSIEAVRISSANRSIRPWDRGKSMWMYMIHHTGPEIAHNGHPVYNGFDAKPPHWLLWFTTSFSMRRNQTLFSLSLLDETIVKNIVTFPNSLPFHITSLKTRSAH